MSRTLRILFSSILVAVTIPAGATFAHADAIDGFTYVANGNGTATVTGCDGSCPTNIAIPVFLDSNTVTAIADDAFKNASLGYVNLPYTLTSIGDYAFAINNITDVVLPSGLTELGWFAFSDNSLTSIDIPSGVTTISVAAFANNQIAQVTFPSSLVEISESAFNGNEMTSLTFPASVTKVDVNAFANTPLSSVEFLGDAPSAGPGALGSSENLKFVDVRYGTSGWGETWAGIPVRVNVPFTYSTSGNGDVSVTSCGGSCPSNLVVPSTWNGNPVVDIAQGAFSNVGLTSVTIPESVTSIGTMAFASNQLTSVTIPASVHTISSRAFQYNSLTSVTFLGNGIWPVSKVFEGNTGLTQINVPYGSTGWDTVWNGLAVHVQDPPLSYTTNAENQVTVTGCIGTCPADLVIPATLGGNPVVAIGTGAFESRQIASVELPDSLITIEDRAFYSNALTSVSLPSGLTTIGVRAFGFNSITSLVIPDSVTTVGDFAFYISPLTGLTLGNSLTSIGEHAFSYGILYSLTLPASLTSIGSNAFAENRLTSLTSLGNAPIAGTDVFYGNANLTSIIVPSNASGWTSTFAGVAVDPSGAPMVVATPTPTPTPTPTETPTVTPTPTPSPTVAPSNVALPKVSGTAKVGSTLNVKVGTWRGTAKITYTYQWYSCSKTIKYAIKTGKIPSTCKAISKATKSTLKLTSSQKSRYVSVLITATNRAGKAKVQSTTTAIVK